MVERALGWVTLAGGAVLWAVDGATAWTLSADQLLCGIASVVLGQGLFRDLREVARRRRAREPGPVEKPVDPPTLSGRIGPELNLCLESTVGLMLLLLALFYVAFPTPPTMTLPRGAIVTGTGVLLLVGWYSRDWVLTLRHIRDHYDVPVWRNRR